MNNNQNIFEKLAQENDFEDFSYELPEQKTPESDFYGPEVEKVSGKNIFETVALEEKKKEENKFGFLDTTRDIGEQIISKGISGIGGAYGNLLETFGLQPQDISEAEKQKYDQEFDILEKIQKGERPSMQDLQDLSDSDFIPRFSRLPTSQEIEKNIEKATGIGEGKTPSGRILGRGSKFFGEALPIPGGGLKTLLGLGASGVAGQTIREAGGPEALATTVEIGGSLIPSIVQGKVVPRGVEAKEIAQAGRSIGLTEKQITPLIQGEKKVATLSKVARKGEKTKERFQSIKESLGDSYSNIKASKEAKVKLPNKEQIQLRKSFSDIRNEMSKTLAPSPEKEAALNYIEKSLETLRDTNVTPEYLVNFWQDINKTVKWNSIQGGKKALSKLKEPVSEILKKTSPKLAKDFEMTNKLYEKYAKISKKLKPDIVDAFLNKAEVIAIPATGIALVQGNPWPLIAVGAESSIRILAKEMLINPYFQNIGSKLVKNFDQGSIKGVTELVNQAKDYMSRKYPEEDWSFLNQD